MAKAKYKPSKAQGSMDPKKRKMQHFQRVSMSSSAAAATETTNQSQKKRKLADTNRSQSQQQQIWKGQKKKNDHHQEYHQRPTIPYRKKDRILLIGEGDFSFARSLFEHHRCKKVFATCYDSRDELLAKYHGQAETNIQNFLNYGDANEDVEEGEGETHTKENSTQEKGKEQTRKVLHSIDARKLGASVVGGGKDIRKGISKKMRKTSPWNKTGNKQDDKQEDGPWDIISFNFPHVGGLSTDVNRQVRANQELLVAFFKACVPLLSRQSGEDDDVEHDDYDDYDYDDDESTDSTSSEESSGEDENNTIRTVPRNSGQIVVTLFEGEPYTLWNVKDLARHAGLVVVTSFKFPWKSYPGYSHARTLGVVESRGHHNNHKSGNGIEREGRGGGWKGEDREARSYVFEVKRDSNQHCQQGSKGSKKRGRGEDGDDDESSDGN